MGGCVCEGGQGDKLVRNVVRIPLIRRNEATRQPVGPRLAYQKHMWRVSCVANVACNI